MKTNLLVGEVPVIITDMVVYSASNFTPEMIVKVQVTTADGHNTWMPSDKILKLAVPVEFE